MTTRWARVGAIAIVVAVAAGCATSRAYRHGEAAARAGEWDLAVAHYRNALAGKPDDPNYRIALQRAMTAASRKHLDQARRLEVTDDLAGALQEYQKANEFDPANRQIAAKAIEVERKLRERAEASRPRPKIEQLKQRARQQSEVVLSPTSRQPIELNFLVDTPIKTILNSIASMSGINIVFAPGLRDQSMTLKLDGYTLEQALQQVMQISSLFYKVVNERTIIVADDSIQNRAKFEDMVIRVFPVSHIPVDELVTVLNQVARAPAGGQQTQQPLIVPSKTSNTVTVRGTAGQVAVIERVIELNDKPRAEITVDVEILEVNRSRSKLYGLNLSDYAIGIAFSPEQAPSSSTSGTSSNPAFNLNSISRGVNTADFYTSVPSAVVKFLETDSESRLIAKPQLQGMEGEKLTLNLGEQIPVPSTTYTPIMSGGTAINPMTSYNYRDVGVNLEITPKVTLEGDVILTMMVETSTLGQDINVAGQNLPTFGTRKVSTKLRLRDGESNLLAGLLREDERKSLKGFPGLLRLPFLKQFFSSNDNEISQTDIVMLLTPRITRSAEITERDLTPINVGTAQNPSLGPPASLFGQVTEPPSAAPSAAPVVEQGPTPIPGVKPTAAGVPAIPPGASPIPGTVMIPVPKPAGEAVPPPAQAPPIQTVPVPAPAAPPTQTPPPAQVVPAAPAAPATAGQPGPQAPAGTARIVVTPPGAERRVGEAPFTVPIPSRARRACPRSPSRCATTRPACASGPFRRGASWGRAASRSPSPSRWIPRRGASKSR